MAGTVIIYHCPVRPIKIKHNHYTINTINTLNKFYICVSVHRSISQIKYQLDASLCRFYFCRVTLHVLGVKRLSSGVL